MDNQPVQPGTDVANNGVSQPVADITQPSNPMPDPQVPPVDPTVNTAQAPVMPVQNPAESVVAVATPPEPIASPAPVTQTDYSPVSVASASPAVQPLPTDQSSQQPSEQDPSLVVGVAPNPLPVSDSGNLAAQTPQVTPDVAHSGKKSKMIPIVIVCLAVVAIIAAIALVLF